MEAKEYRDKLLNMLLKHGVNGSDGFRQWFYRRPYGYNSDYEISAAAKDSIEQAVACEPDIKKAFALRVKIHG